MAQPALHLPAGQAHEDLTTWARQNGITIHKVKVAAIPNAGIGVIATTDIKAGENLVFTPSSLLLTREVALASVPTLPIRTDKDGNKLGLQSLRTHALIAAVLATNSYKKQKPWQDVWPNRKSFKEFMPLLWPQEMLRLLTPGAKSYVSRQRSKLEKEFWKVRGVGFNVTKKAFEHAWVIVNTRTLFYKPSTYQDVLREDCMCLCPFIDYFNHSDEGCKVDLSTKGFTVISNREYKTGDQIFVSYGPHNNDFLLCEYGFILDNNKYDDISIDTLIFDRLKSQHISYLEDRSFLGDYALDRSGLCFRSQVALRISFLQLRSGNVTEKLIKWQKYIDGVYDGSGEDHLVREAEADIYSEFIHKAHEVNEQLLDSKWPSSIRKIIKGRWEQVLDIIREAESKRILDE